MDTKELAQRIYMEITSPTEGDTSEMILDAHIAITAANIFKHEWELSSLNKTIYPTTSEINNDN